MCDRVPKSSVAAKVHVDSPLFRMYFRTVCVAAATFFPLTLESTKRSKHFFFHFFETRSGKVAQDRFDVILLP